MGLSSTLMQPNTVTVRAEKVEFDEINQNCPILREFGEDFLKLPGLVELIAVHSWIIAIIFG